MRIPVAASWPAPAPGVRKIVFLKSTYSPFLLLKGESGSMLPSRAPGSATVATPAPTASPTPFKASGVAKRRLSISTATGVSPLPATSRQSRARRRYRADGSERLSGPSNRAYERMGKLERHLPSAARSVPANPASLVLGSRAQTAAVRRPWRRAASASSWQESRIVTVVTDSGPKVGLFHQDYVHFSW
jgi:hypothetical protein